MFLLLFYIASGLLHLQVSIIILLIILHLVTVAILSVQTEVSRHDNVHLTVTSASYQGFNYLSEMYVVMGKLYSLCIHCKKRNKE